MRVVICWMGVSGYLSACWRALSARGDVDLTVVTFPDSAQTAFALSPLTQGLNCRLLNDDERDDPGVIASIVADARPDVVAIAGWGHRAYRQMVKDPRLAGVRLVMGMDTPWSDRLRKRAAGYLLHGYLRRIDRVIVAGERAWQYARALGVPEARVRRGMYGADVRPLLPLHARRMALATGWPRRFVFVGRYAEEKGIDVLVEAYRRYRAAVTNPWPLTCCGKGPLQPLLSDVEGIEDAGFVQPGELPDVLLRHGVFVLPSRYEPFGLVIVEAAASGLPILCTEACGASVEVVRSHYNGLTVASGDAADLVRGMLWFHHAADRLPTMGGRAIEFAAAYGADVWAERWAATFHEVVSEHPRDPRAPRVSRR